MADVQVAAPVQPTTLTYAQAAQKYAESKVEKPNPVSEAAKTLGQRSATARQERQAATDAEAQPEAESTAEATQGDTTETDTALTDEQAAETEAQDDGPIDLGEGVSLTKDEIRQNILRQADYTRKTQDLAEMRKALDAERSTKLTQLDTVIAQLQQRAGQPKSLKQWLADDRFAQLKPHLTQIERRLAEFSGQAARP